MTRTHLGAAMLASIAALAMAPTALAAGGGGGSGGGSGGGGGGCQPLQMPVATGIHGGHFVVSMPVTVTNCLKAPEGWTLTVTVNRPGDPEFLYTLSTGAGVQQAGGSITVTPDLKPVSPSAPITTPPTSPIPETITATLTETFPTPQVLSTITDTILIPVGLPTTV
jgi:hypothetical protein